LTDLITFQICRSCVKAKKPELNWIIIPTVLIDIIIRDVISSQYNIYSIQYLETLSWVSDSSDYPWYFNSIPRQVTNKTLKNISTRWSMMMIKLIKSTCLCNKMIAFLSFLSLSLSIIIFYFTFYFLFCPLSPKFIEAFCFLIQWTLESEWKKTSRIVERNFQNFNNFYIFLKTWPTKNIYYIWKKRMVIVMVWSLQISYIFLTLVFTSSGVDSIMKYNRILIYRLKKLSRYISSTSLYYNLHHRLRCSEKL
jgi:hypothetical protein